MQNAIEIVKERIQFLDDLVKITPVKRAITAMARLAEAKKILERLEAAQNKGD